MRIRGRGNVVAIALAGVAIVLAASGTAVAVTISKVNIADPTTPSHIAKVDAGGRLSTAAALSTIDATGYVSGFQNQTFTQLTSPTAATLAITRIQLSDPASNGAAPEQQLSVGKYPVDGTGACDTTATPQLVARYNLASGGQVDDVLPSPLVVKPTGTAKYCLEIYVTYLALSTTTVGWYLTYNLSAYASAGSYTGLGVNAVAAHQPASARITR